MSPDDSTRPFGFLQEEGKDCLRELLSRYHVTPEHQLVSRQDVSREHAKKIGSMTSLGPEFPESLHEATQVLCNDADRLLIGAGLFRLYLAHSVATTDDKLQCAVEAAEKVWIARFGIDVHILDIRRNLLCLWLLSLRDVVELLCNHREMSDAHLPDRNVASDDEVAMQIREVRQLTESARGSSDETVLSSFAEIVRNEGASRLVREIAYQGMFEIAEPPVEEWPMYIEATRGFSFPDDVDWEFVRFWLR